MRKIGFVILLLASVLMATPVSENGALSFNSEGRIVNEKGDVVQLRGMSFYWDRWGGENFFNENVVRTLATDWKASVIRVPDSYLSVDRATNMIDYANNNGIYVIIDYHSHCAHKKTNESADFFSKVSAYVKQKGYKHVIYELYNEPLYANCEGDPTDTRAGGAKTEWTTIKAYASSVISKIRANDPNGLILVGTPNYSQDIASAQKDPIEGKNIGYVLHFYASQSGHSGLKTSLLRARCQNFPVFITEWGTTQASGDGDINWTMVNEWMAWIEELGYSWANWSLSNISESSAAINWQGSSQGGWSDNQLTSSGSYVRKMIRGFNSGSTLAAMGLSKPSMQSCSIFEEGKVFEFEWTGFGEFGVAIDAENYADSSNIHSVQDKNIHAYQDIYVETTGNDAWAKYEMRNVPAEGYYRLVFLYQAPSRALDIPYTVDGVEGTQHATLPLTTNSSKFGAGILPIHLKEGTNYVTFDLGGVTAADLKFDAFWATSMDSSDSVDFGLLEVDENGNRIVKTPEFGGDDDIFAAIAPERSSLVQVQLQGRTLSLAGVDGEIALNIMDLQGRVMLTKRVRSGQVDLSSLRSGSYVLRATARGAVVNQRINLK